MEVVDLGCERLTFAADAMNVLIRYGTKYCIKFVC
jgi:hypothetical protein